MEVFSALFSRYARTQGAQTKHYRYAFKPLNKAASKKVNEYGAIGLASQKAARVSRNAAMAAAGAKLAGKNPWLGKIKPHGPHGGGPHQYRHLQIMVRTGKSTTKHIRIPY